ncbi:hypothetical protein ACN2WE_21595 [Streptomyces sp. cg28]|uniref:hypothetical protein n=1 Tax=Streptomyces sp. cg28 TaxID=3403457 RepID=UPI003B228E53
MFLTWCAVPLVAAALAWLPVTAGSATADTHDPTALLTAAQCRARGGVPAFRVFGGGDAYRCVRRVAGAGPSAGGPDTGFAYVRRPRFDLDYLAPAECRAGGGVPRWADDGDVRMCRGGAYDGRTVAPAV